MGPEPWIRFFDRLAAGDTEGCEAVLADIEGVALPIPDFSQFACYNTQLEKARIDAAGYMRCGPPRPPYTDLPEDWREAAETNGSAWAELCKRYRESGRSSPDSGQRRPGTTALEDRQATAASSVPSALSLSEAMERAEWLADRVRGRRSITEAQRRLPDETIEDFVHSDLLRMNQARRWGGHELGCAAVVEIVSKVAEGDGSSGWVLGLLASHFWLCSVFGDELQEDMWVPTRRP